MLEDLRELKDRRDELKSDRQREEPRWRELARILRPEDQEFAPGERLDRRGIDTFDSTPLYALDDFVGGLFGEGVNPAERWFEFDIAEGGDAELKSYKPVKQWLWDLAAVVQGTLAPQVSSFYTEAPGWFADMAAFGDGGLYQEEIPGRGIVDRAVPKGRSYYGRGVDGRIDTVLYEMPMTGRQAKQRWPEVGDLARDGVEYTITHLVRPNREANPRRIGRGSMGFAGTFFCEEIRDWRADGGYRELPYHFVEWDRRAGRTYARGPGHNALPDMNMLDEMQYSNLKSLQFESSPIWLTSSDDVMTAADIQPDAVISGAISENGKELAKIAPRGDNLQLPIGAAEQIRNAIHRAFKFSLWNLANRPQMTATEWNGWKEEELKAAAPHLVRVQQGLSSFIGRRYRLLTRARRIPPPPPEMSGQAMRIEFVSPFAKALKLAKARGATQLAQTALSLKELFPDIADNLNGDNLIATIHDGVSSDPSLIRDPREVQAMRQARAQAQAQQVQIEQMAQAASTYADVAHAQQAQTLAGGRKAKAA
jgi:hypothetical protein